jgi:methionine-rich copper-binding protein CopC
MLVAAMLAMMMVAASPAMAHSVAVGGDVQAQFQNSPQTITQTATATQTNSGGGTGAAVAQNLSISQSASNVSLQAGDDIFIWWFWW